MIVQFSNGAGVESSVIAGIYVEGARADTVARIHVYVFRENLMMFGSGKPTASHFMSIPMKTDEEAEAECRRLVDVWRKIK